MHISIHISITSTMCTHRYAPMLSCYQTPTLTSPRLRLLLREVVYEYISVYSLHPLTLPSLLVRGTIIPPLYDLIISTYLSYTSNETFLSSFDNQIQDCYSVLIQKIARYLPFDLPRLLMDLPCYIYEQIPCSLRCELGNAVLEEIHSVLRRNSVSEFINQSHFEKYFQCKICIPSLPNTELPHLLTPAPTDTDVNKPKVYSRSRSYTQHSISQTLWAKSLDSFYIDKLFQELERSAFFPSQARSLSNKVLDYACRLALHRASVDYLHKMLIEDLASLILEVRSENEIDEAARLISFHLSFHSGSTRLHSPSSTYGMLLLNISDVIIWHGTFFNSALWFSWNLRNTEFDV